MAPGGRGGQKEKRITQAGVRALMLAAQGLQERNAPATKEDVRLAIRRMNALQIDTIHVVARSPYLVLWSRLGGYDVRWLDELLAEGALFEWWAHAACLLPIEDYPLFRALMLAGARWAGRASWLQTNAETASVVLGQIRANGAVRSADFERTDGEKGSWWNWKAEKMALECLLDAGDLMVARRDNFQRVYDLRERVLPDWTDANAPAIGHVHRQLVLNSVQALGVTRPEWVADYMRLSKADARAALAALTADSELKMVAVEGWETPGLYHPENEDLVVAASDGELPASRTTLLSPFDPVVWDRARALDLFGFDYRIECYTPAEKRRYGYFTLPILYHNALIGRLDPKAHRKEGVFEVKALHLEPGMEVDDELVSELRTALRECAAWHGTPRVVVREANVRGLAKGLSD